MFAHWIRYLQICERQLKSSANWDCEIEKSSRSEWSQDSSQTTDGITQWKSKKLYVVPLTSKLKVSHQELYRSLLWIGGSQDKLPNLSLQKPWDELLILMRKIGLNQENIFINLKRQWATCKWESHGWSRNWLKEWTTYVRSALVRVTYKSLPMSCQYTLGSRSNSPSLLLGCRFCSIGKMACLAPRKPMSQRISSAYLLWKIEISLVEYATSSRKKTWEDRSPSAWFENVKKILDLKQ